LLKQILSINLYK